MYSTVSPSAPSVVCPYTGASAFGGEVASHRDCTDEDVDVTHLWSASVREAEAAGERKVESLLELAGQPEQRAQPARVCMFVFMKYFFQIQKRKEEKRK
jgi:hypothetical protein